MEENHAFNTDFKTKMFWTNLLFYTCIIIMALWVIAKLMGWIKSPMWIEMLPYISAVIAFLNMGMSIGRFSQKIEFMHEDIHFLKDKYGTLNENFTKLEKNFIKIEKDVEYLKKHTA